jgi:hypothetical protein
MESLDTGLHREPFSYFTAQQMKSQPSRSVDHGILQQFSIRCGDSLIEAAAAQKRPRSRISGFLFFNSPFTGHLFRGMRN